MSALSNEIKWPRDTRAELVQAVGALTTLVALAGVYAVAKGGFNLMLFYANYIIPIGAIGVGAVAASGYAIAGWWTGLKMSRRLIWSVVAQLAISYFIAQYEMFRSFVPEGSSIGFFSWFDATTRGFSFSKGGSFGAFGYAMRALELAGFVFGGWMVPVALRSKPYCESCRSYKRTSTLVKLPAGSKRKTFGKISVEAEQEICDAGMESVKTIFAAALTGDRKAFHQVTAPLDKITANLRSAIWVELVRCPRCFDGYLSAKLLTGQGTQTLQLTRIGEQSLTKEQVRAIV